MDAREAGERIERELLILTRNRETSTPRGVRDGGALDRSAYVLLSRLEAQGPMSIPDFVEAFGFNASTFTRQTSALLRDGLVERTLDPDGGVARKFRVTDKGSTRLAEQREEFVSRPHRRHRRLARRTSPALRRRPGAVQHRHRTRQRTFLATPDGRRTLTAKAAGDG